jgi:hypothetical protein
MTKRLVWFGILAAFALIAGCNPSSGSPSGDGSYAGYLYMTDTMSGKVYTYDPVSRSASATSIASVGQNATGELAFYQGIGYVCVGLGTNAGVHYFDPSAANPSFAKIPGTVCAQYCAFANSSKAYVSVFDYSGDTDGIYTFNPSSPGSGLSQAALTGTSGDSYQEVIIAPDGYLYAANNTDGSVVKIDTATDAIVATIHATAIGTTGLFAGTYKGSAGVFVANTGGSIDFIEEDAADGSTATAVVSTSIYPARIVQLQNGNLAATGYDSSWINHTYLVDLSGDTAVASEVLYEDASFGSLDIAYRDGLVYVPATVTSDYISYTNYLYIVGEDGKVQSYSPISVMGSSESISNIAFYED